MSQSTIELKIPDEVYERARQIAKVSQRSVESVLQDSLALMFGAVPDAHLSPADLATYDDEQLWAIVHQHLIWTQDVRLRHLIELGKHSPLTDDEQAEMERLIDLVDHQMLLRSEALLLLKKRGHDVEKLLNLGA